jgi:hypothetical protein
LLKIILPESTKINMQEDHISLGQKLNALKGLMVKNIIDESILNNVNEIRDSF